MKLDLTAPTPLGYFALLVASDAQLPLLEAAASLAQDEHPALDVQQVLAEVDQLALRLRRRVRADASSLDRVVALNRWFFGDLGFAGNLNHYDDPDNSYLHRVLHTRRGIPISLAVLWLELARSLGLQAEGVSFPGHFLVQVELEQGRVVIDPLTGQSLGRSELRERMDDFLPARQGLDAMLGQVLQPSQPRHILARMLRNLQHIHRSQRDGLRLLAVQDRLITLLPQAWDAYRDRGLTLAELGEHQRACADLGLYLRHASGAGDHLAITKRLAQLSGRQSG